MTDIPVDVLEAAAKVVNDAEAECRKERYLFGFPTVHGKETLDKHIARAILADRAAQAERLVRLEEALRDIRDGRGKCKTCGTPATGGGAGFTDCDCVRPSWTPQDPADIAARALSQEGS